MKDKQKSTVPIGHTDHFGVRELAVAKKPLLLGAGVDLGGWVLWMWSRGASAAFIRLRLDQIEYRRVM